MTRHKERCNPGLITIKAAVSINLYCVRKVTLIFEVSPLGNCYSSSG